MLFIGRDSSARSILAEAVMNRVGAGKFVGYSAGAQPSGIVHPETIAILNHLQFDTTGLRSKSWEEFTGDGSPRMDAVITLSHSAAQESCPLWPGEPIGADWLMPNPMTGEEDLRQLAFAVAYQMINHRISIFTRLTDGDRTRSPDSADAWTGSFPGPLGRV